MNSLIKDKMVRRGFHLTSIDLFSGPGGLATGFKWAGILPLIAVEWTDTTAKTYSLNHDTDVFELSAYIGPKGKKDQSYLESFCVESDRSVLIHGDINLVSSQLIKKLLMERFGIDCQNETIDTLNKIFLQDRTVKQYEIPKEEPMMAAEEIPDNYNK
jgi:DNA (cytosine-5)-methyltransferase 1